MYTLQLHLKHPLANLKKNQKKKLKIGIFFGLPLMPCQKSHNYHKFHPAALDKGLRRGPDLDTVLFYNTRRRAAL